MKTIQEVLADGAATLDPLGEARSIIEGDVLAVLTEAMTALQAGGGLELPSQGATPVEDAITGTAWQELDLFSTGAAIPPAGGKGLAPNLSSGTLTVESGGGGWYLVMYSVSADSTAPLELSVERERGASKTYHVPSRLPGLFGVWPVSLAENDIVRMVGRTGVGLTADLSYYSAQLFLFRILPT